jgi:hypothetical protein
MIWYLDIKGEKIMGAYSEKLNESMIQMDLEDTFDRTRNIYKDGEIVPIDDNQRRTIYNEEVYFEEENALQAMMTASARASFLNELDDTEAAKLSLCYDSWTTGKAYKVGDRVLCDGKLWKCRQAHTSQENWKPSINTASLWEVINVENAGTLEDPIPYDQTMTVYNGKYYLEEGIIYKCIRDSGQPLYATCASLVGNYFEVVE